MNEIIAWIVFAESEGKMVPQYPAMFSQDEAKRHAGMYGQTKTEVVPLYRVDDPDAENEWRRLALQFDGHRMQALYHLKMMMVNPDKHAPIVDVFLKAPPLSGEEVLSQRIGAMSVKPEAKGEAVGVNCPECGVGTKHDSSCSRVVVPAAPADDEPSEIESLIACLGDDATTLTALNHDDEMAQTMRDAVRYLSNIAPTDKGKLPDAYTAGHYSANRIVYTAEQAHACILADRTRQSARIRHLEHERDLARQAAAQPSGVVQAVRDALSLIQRVKVGRVWTRHDESIVMATIGIMDDCTTTPKPTSKDSIANHLFIEPREDGIWHVCVEKVHQTMHEAQEACRDWIKRTTDTDDLICRLRKQVDDANGKLSDRAAREDGWRSVADRQPDDSGWYLCHNVEVASRPENPQHCWFIWVRDFMTRDTKPIPEVLFYYRSTKSCYLRNALGNAVVSGRESRTPVVAQPTYWRKVPDVISEAAK